MSKNESTAPTGPAAGTIPTLDPAPLSEARGRGGAEEPPPFLGSWRNVYALVLGELAVTALLFYALTRWAS